VEIARLAAMALACVEREFPYNPAHVVRDAGDVHRPRELHPAFYGCFDWHSSVHGHWLLAHALKRGEDPAIRRVLNQHLSAANLGVEARYLRKNPAFERPYGWAWLLKLATELDGWNDPDARRWSEALQPLAEVVEANYLAWLPRQTYPIRAGTHVNTAFGLAFALDYARLMRKDALEKAIAERCITYFAEDRHYPADWEPGGNDFLSPCLIEADLMRRVLPDFASWLAHFLPVIPRSLCEPATVSDRSDGQLAHLDGLNLSRAWCFSNLGETKLAQRHLQAGLAGLEGGHYEGEHWLATFAAYAAACALDAATTTPASRSAATWRE
jgi:hypothetical protein